MRRKSNSETATKCFMKAAAILFVCLLLSSSARAAEGRETSLPVLDENASLADYLRYAALNNPGLEAAWLRWKAALEKAPQVRALPDPRFTYRYFIERVETRVGPQRQSFGIAQTFPWLAKLRLRGDMAMEAAKAQRERYEAIKLALFFRVKDAYYEYFYLARAIDIVRENRNLLKYLEEVVRTRYKVAKAGYQDVIRAQVELGKVDDRLRTLEDLRDPLVARLNAALNRPIGAPLPWPRGEPAGHIAAADEQIFAWFREASPELKALDHEAARERHGISLARQAYFPDVTLGLDYIDTAGARMSNVSDSGKDPLVAMVSLNIPIWFGKYRAAEREARARRRSVLKTRADKANTLLAGIKLVLYKLRDAERKIDLYRDTLLPKAKQSLKATETAYRAGNATFSGLVDAQRVLLAFQLSYERAQADYNQRLAECEMLVGRGIPRAGASAPSQGAKTVNDNKTAGEK